MTNNRSITRADEAHRPRGPSDHAGWTNLGGAYGQGEVIEIVDVSHGKEELDGAQARDCKLELPILSPAGIGNFAACHPAALDPVPKAILCPLRMDPDNLEPEEIALDELRPGRVVRRIQAELRNARVDGFDVRPPLAVVLTNCRRFASNPTGAAGSARLDDTLRTWFDRLVAIKKAVAAGRR